MGSGALGKASLLTGVVLSVTVVLSCVATTSFGSFGRPDPALRPAETLDLRRPVVLPQSKTAALSKSEFVWNPVSIGGGGMVTGIDIAADSLSLSIVIRTDTYGAYKWNGASWDQLVSSVSLPFDQRVPRNGGGVYALAHAPSRMKTLYMAYRGYIFLSRDGGKTWLKTQFAGVPFDANAPTRAWGPRLAVDPTNPDIVLFATPQDGTYISRDAGGKWMRVAVPAGGLVNNWPAGNTWVGFVGNQLMVAVAGDGIYQSSDGVTWRLAPDSPKIVVSAHTHPDGSAVFVPFLSPGSEHGEVWTFRAGQFSRIVGPMKGWSDALEVTTIALDPADSNRVLLTEADGKMWMSTNRGEKWTRLTASFVGGDTPWIAQLLASDSGFLTTGDIAFDPKNRDVAWMTMGTGVLRVTGLAGSDGKVEVRSVTAGIEQLVVNRVLALPTGKLLVAVHDFGVFQVKDLETSNVVKGPVNRFIGGWDIAYSPFEPSFVAGDFANIINEGDLLAGSSRDGGQTWTTFPERPLGEPSVSRNLAKVGFPGCGQVAVSSPKNIVWMPTGRYQPWNNSYGGCFRLAQGAQSVSPHVTNDGGQTWSPIELENFTATPENSGGFDFEYYLARKSLAADTVKEGTFYLLHAYAGVFRSIDGGRNWKKVSDKPSGGGWEFNSDLQAVPGRAGHLFLTDGGQGGHKEIGPNDYFGSQLLRTTNGGETWEDVPHVDWVTKIGFGKAQDLGGYPTIFLAGRVRGKWGFWRSADDTRTWKSMGEFPNDSLDTITSIDGDKNVFGRVYVGFGGSGVAYGEPNPDFPVKPMFQIQVTTTPAKSGQTKSPAQKRAKMPTTRSHAQR